MSPNSTATTAASDGLLATAGSVPAQTFTGQFLEYALLFFVLALVAAVLGARGVAGLSMEIAKWMVIIFVVLAVIALIL